MDLFCKKDLANLTLSLQHYPYVTHTVLSPSEILEVGADVLVMVIVLS